MKPQTVFNKVAKHLLTQKRQSQLKCEDTLSIVCVYRNDEGLKCAVGCLIPKNMYDKDMEGLSLDSLATYGIPGISSDNLGLLMDLQRVHDCNTPSYWKSKLKAVAKLHGLLFK